ncbi:ribosomal L7Ae/L30e/S12e/Gadd45 family protein [Clostridium rectalis]|uniref:ribosomal L7Ae/L30e/S12e/Gadd45 family protein n=1 Tax=Clostridium rectalis TaxID=2040295 RepID=UPI000F63F80B|nr:ribosomal L7Ae/L30e/S12e/Gadd45 family protein [Clostridium rectalis]
MNNKFLGFLGITKKAGKCIEGYNKCEEAIKKNICNLIVVSVDTSQNTKDKFSKLCIDRNIPIIIDFSKLVLSNTLGRNEINILGISDEIMGKRLLELWKD